MKNTNEIEKQLQRKADNYLEQKAKEIQNILKEVKEFAGVRASFYDYIADYTEFKHTDAPKADDSCRFTDFGNMKDKFHKELKLNFKNALVAKYTKELITKLEIFE
tara:strand:- start:970 stop:1287 length:318 start_codon:yes stop_codon:yes gene_type:complete